MSRTVAYEYYNETWFLSLPDMDHSDVELEALVKQSIYNLVAYKHRAKDEAISPEQCQVEADAVPWQIVDGTTLPKDRYFRAALRADKGKFLIDMDHAREIHLGRIREARNIKLAALDVETMKAVGKGDDQARNEVEAQKQILRDIPQTLDLSKAKTPDELRAIWPSELN